MTIRQLIILCCLLMASLVIRLHAASGTLETADSCSLNHPNAQCFELHTQEQMEGGGAPIILPVQWLPARSERLARAPIVWLNGGPGLSNLDPPLPDWVYDYFDVLVIGYRGIDGSPRLDCPNLKASIERVQKDKSVSFLSDEAFSIWRHDVQNCQQALETAGFNTAAYGTLDVVNDIEEVRQALELPQISLLSASYGTRIAWYYDQQHPGKLYRSLMMSGNPTGGFYFDPMTADRQLRLLSEWCASDAHCRDLTPDLYTSINRVVKHPPKSAWGVRIDPDHLRLTTFMLLYSRSTWPMLADAYGKAERGNSSGLAAMLKFPNPMTGRDWVWGPFFSAGSIDYDNTRDYGGELEVANQRTALGSPLSELIFEGLSPGWNTESTLPPNPRNSATPTLILGSEVDVATPIERIEAQWMPWLSQGQLISVEGAGHAPDHVRAGGMELETLLVDFLSGAQTDTRQSFGQPADWKPKFSLSWLVYAVWAGIGVLGAAAIYGLITLI